MTDKQIICAEIEKLRKEYDIDTTPIAKYQIAQAILNRLSDVIDSLQEEPVSEDLLSIHPCKVCKIGVKSTEEPVSEDLEEEDSFDELLQKLYIKYNKGVSIEKLLDIASNFVKWQKEKDRKGFELLKEWFEEIAERCSRLTSGNVSHNGKAIRGFARNCAEYIKTDLL